MNCFTKNQRAINKNVEMLGFSSHIEKVSNTHTKEKQTPNKRLLTRYWQKGRETVSNFKMYMFFDTAIRHLS